MGGIIDTVGDITGIGSKPKPNRSAQAGAEDEKKRLDELEKKRRKALFGTEGGQLGALVKDEDVGRRGSVLGN